MPEKTVLIEKTSKRLKLYEGLGIAATLIFILAGLGLMYVWFPLGIICWSFAGIGFIGFIVVRVKIWWQHG